MSEVIEEDQGQRQRRKEAGSNAPTVHGASETRPARAPAKPKLQPFKGAEEFKRGTLAHAMHSSEAAHESLERGLKESERRAREKKEREAQRQAAIDAECLALENARREAESEAEREREESVETEPLEPAPKPRRPISAGLETPPCLGFPWYAPGESPHKFKSSVAMGLQPESGSDKRRRLWKMGLFGFGILDLNRTILGRRLGQVEVDRLYEQNIPAIVTDPFLGEKLQKRKARRGVLGYGIVNLNSFPLAKALLLPLGKPPKERPMLL